MSSTKSYTDTFSMAVKLNLEIVNFEISSEINRSMVNMQSFIPRLLDCMYINIFGKPLTYKSHARLKEALEN